MSKKYRVVCTKEKFKDKIIIDIAVADGVIHDMIYASRKTKNPKLEDYAGSVYLIDSENGNPPQISFANMDGIPKNCELYRYYERLAKELIPQISAVYARMKASGRESTLDIRLNDYFAAFQNKGEIKNPWDERMQEYDEKRKRIEKLKKQTLADKARENSIYSPEILMAWKQALRRGD